jgi:hypothetical protein
MPASSLLLILYMLWSIPVIIYVVLFSPGLRRLSTGGTSKIVEPNDAASELPFECLLPTIAAATIALMFGLLAGLSWPRCLMLMGALAALIGGAAFSLLKMHRLALSQPVGSSDRVATGLPVDSNRSATTSLAAPPRGLARQSAFLFQPYPHHEDYPESAGEDQGQLTSHLSGSTPWLEDLDIPMMWRIIRCCLVRRGTSVKESAWRSR